MISIIIPCFNHGQYLNDCLESIYSNNTNQQIEVIIVDDCSTDTSYEVAKSLQSKYKFQLFKSPQNMKLSAVRNYGIELSKGEFIICLDADDKIPDNYIQENYNNLLMNKVDISYNNSVMFGAKEATIDWPEFDHNYFKINPFVHCASMFKKEIWQKNKYDESMIYGWEDYDFWMSAFKNGYQFKKCNSTFLYYRQTNKNMSNDTHRNLHKIKKYMKMKHNEYYNGINLNKFKIVIPVYNAERWVDRCLESIINQTFTNWECIIVNDSSTDNTLEVVKATIKKHPEIKSKFKLMNRTINVGALANIVYGINNGCNNNEDVVVLIDGDDWLASNDVFEYLDNVYDDNNIWLTYGRFVYLSDNALGSSTSQIKNTRKYRSDDSFRTSHLRTFKFKIWKNINDVDLRDSHGQYYTMAWDMAIMYPLIEMCGSRRIKCSDKVLYIYNDTNPMNDHKKNQLLQIALDQEIRKKPQYREIP